MLISRNNKIRLKAIVPLDPASSEATIPAKEYKKRPIIILVTGVHVLLNFNDFTIKKNKSDQ